MTSGKKTYDEQLVELEEELSTYLDSLGVVPTKTSPIEEMISVGRDELRGMSASDCEQNALLLTQYCIDLQVRFNKLHAIIQWIDSNIDDIVIPHVGDYKAYSYEERKKLAIQDNSAAKMLNEKRREFALRKDSTYGVISKVETMAKFYGEIAKSKKWNR